MADPLSVIFALRPNRRVAIGAITLDATVDEHHEFSNEITDHPIETGSFVTDHVYEQPRKVSIEGEVTNSPVQYFGNIIGISDRKAEAFDQLVALRDSRDIVTLVTGLKIYNDMAIESIVIPRNQRTGERLQFTATFKQIRKVSSQVVGVISENVAEPQKDQASSEVDIGRQEPAEATAPQAERGASILTRVLQ